MGGSRVVSYDLWTLQSELECSLASHCEPQAVGVSILVFARCLRGKGQHLCGAEQGLSFPTINSLFHSLMLEHRDDEEVLSL